MKKLVSLALLLSLSAFAQESSTSNAQPVAAAADASIANCPNMAGLYNFSKLGTRGSARVGITRQSCHSFSVEDLTREIIYTINADGSESVIPEATLQILNEKAKNKGALGVSVLSARYVTKLSNESNPYISYYSTNVSAVIKFLGVHATLESTLKIFAAHHTTAYVSISAESLELTSVEIGNQTVAGIVISVANVALNAIRPLIYVQGFERGSR